MKALQADLDEAVAGREAWIVSRSRDGKHMLVLVTAPNDPGSYYYYSPEEGVMHRMASVNERLKGRTPAPTRPVGYQARELYAKALQAAGKPVEYVAYEKEGHGFNDPAKLQDYLDRLEAFLAKYNPAG